MGAAVIFLFLFYHPPSFEMLHEHKSKKQQIKELDYPGMFLWTAGLVLFLMGISWVQIYPKGLPKSLANYNREEDSILGSLPL